MYKRLNKLFKQILNIAIPQKCMVCGAFVEGGLCSGCWSELDFISAPYCPICHLPFEYEMGEGVPCQDCLKRRPAYTVAYSVFVYNECSKSVITRFKYGDALHYLPHLARLLHTKTREIRADMIVPVPLHYKRLVGRRYNQAALLAKVLGKLSKRYVLQDALLRVKNTPPQAALHRKERRTNIAGAFRANPKHAHALKGKSILLVDDVMTTGSTLQECAKVLKQVGAKKVYCATVARTVRAE